MNQIKITYNKTKSKPFTLEIIECNGVKQTNRKVDLSINQLKRIQQDICICFLEHKVHKENANF